MKALVCLLLLFIASNVYAAEELSWTPVNMPCLEISSSLGYLPSNNGLWFYGDFGWLNAGQKLFLTHDAGRSWTLSLTASDHHTFFDTYFINPLEGFAVLDSYPTLLFRTQDGGESWESVEVKLTRTSLEPAGYAYLTYIYFKDSIHGLGTFPVDGFPYPLAYFLARTDDGGEHWTEIKSGGGKMVGFGDEVRIGSNSYTPDFGETFQRFSLPINSEPFEPFFVTPLYGWTIDYSRIGESSPRIIRRDILKTTDGGHTWSVIFSKTDIGDGSSIWSLYLMSEEVGGFLRYPSEESVSPLLYMTYDGGLSWFSYKVPFRYGYYEVSCNREQEEIWLIPTRWDEDMTIFYASMDKVTSVNPKNKLLSTWASMKKIRKEY